MAEEKRPSTTFAKLLWAKLSKIDLEFIIKLATVAVVSANVDTKRSPLNDGVSVTKSPRFLEQHPAHEPDTSTRSWLRKEHTPPKPNEVVTDYDNDVEFTIKLCDTFYTKVMTYRSPPQCSSVGLRFTDEFLMNAEVQQCNTDRLR
ncbi:uncharacterized protein CCOS01_16443 [Colletotrichum costaricense]|uniref:Uncharacterized protein n=1 Tax=Colletotrichum costaricense TaxID=1209916 RepID=A0AAJ0DS99_9PEZI|nr:uncharacterized protein CCOS01_16443 [Colletotrichum costaricense]KAK1506584.1 hypothetical protein CCOS01_16443 [Colletotrichum costaricense]